MLNKNELKSLIVSSVTPERIDALLVIYPNLTNLQEKMSYLIDLFPEIEIDDFKKSHTLFDTYNLLLNEIIRSNSNY